MIKTTSMTRVSMALLVAAGAVMAGCSDREDMTAGQKLDAAVASAQEEGRELQAEAREAGDAAQAQMAEAQAKLAPEAANHAEVQQLLDFLTRSERGIIR